MAMTGYRPKPWVKLWRDERGAFATLPLFARALDAELTRAADDHGRIEIGDRSHADGLAFVLGATTSDRRLLRRYLPELERVGRVRLEAGAIVLVAWGEEQGEPRHGEERATSRARVEHESSTSRARVEHESSTNGERAEHEIPDKCSKSLEPLTRAPAYAHEEGEGEGDKEGELTTNAREAARDVVVESSDPVSKDLAKATGAVAEAQRALLRGYQARYESAVNDAWMGSARCHGDILTCAKWVAAKGARHVETRAKRLLDTAFADPALTAASWPWAWIARDPGRYGAARPVSQTGQGSGRGRAGGFVRLAAEPADDAEWSSEPLPEVAHG